MILRSLGQYRDVGLLLLRIGVGLMFAFVHGLPKLRGGPETWETFGAAMGVLGITLFPVFWGFMAAITEFLGGILFLLGFAFRPACILLAFVMLVAAWMHLDRGDGLKGAAAAIELGVVFLGLLFVGPGRHSLDRG